MPYYLNPPPQGPLTRLIASIVAVIVLIGAFMLGMVALLVIAGVALVAGLAIWLRVAWIKRQLRKSGVNLDAHRDTTRESGHVIDAEYTVVTDPEDKKDE
jgi:membrane protein implicated in regulation of membrane protease activity